MSKTCVLLSSVLLAACFAAPAPVSADYYDNFDDGSYENPGPFDPCNPDWTTHEIIASAYYSDAGTGELLLWANSDSFPHAFIAASVDGGDHDANTSQSYFDDHAAHYILGKVRPGDPERGDTFLALHADFTQFSGYVLSFLADDDSFALRSWEGAGWVDAGPRIIRGDLDEENGFWMALQFDSDGDPNHSYLRAAAWNGDRGDWDGVWDLDQHIMTALDANDHDYFGEGVCGVAALDMPVEGLSATAYSVFDNIECRWGTVPEPSGLTCLAFAAFAALCRRRR